MTDRGRTEEALRPNGRHGKLRKFGTLSTVRRVNLEGEGSADTFGDIRFESVKGVSRLVQCEVPRRFTLTNSVECCVTLFVFEPRCWGIRESRRGESDT